MGNLKKKNIIILIIVTIIALTIGCTAKSIHDRNITKEKATIAATEHMKKEENIDFMVTDIKVYHLELAGSIKVTGYDKNDKQKRYYVDINKIQNYKVKTWGKE
ncbi:hypothetical protein P4U05_16660 [Bacillus paranthracis]|uniref:hypothetical protein n=1 Tax=Bacillus paranthracis TaxID=2026186 RepID=UPI000200F5EA|nr:hypothetical protein [Bacillus paranthracis]ADY20418.1 hypothetical protein YBT020_05860 [Bacillus thuringiensis serovar finitimus YBT-020]MRC72899.1 hypothetical protein [Bacillus thuringiensis]OTX71358.1 hypothetical protein BK722_13185 [Bacillus thuringiensis serovar finitimus]MCR6799311.1 hypothetical protein [Bacillus paranthracis]MEC3358530.1 hypothetical protein [Bacillus paranthracis]